MRNKMFLAAIGLVMILALTFFALKESTNSSSTETEGNAATEGAASAFQVIPVDSSLLIKAHSPIKGAMEAKVTIVEFLDPECEACGAMAPIVKELFESYKNNVKLVVRYMPYHGNSKYVANILEGVRAENKYWEALELLFSTQSQWADHHNPNPDLIPEILKPLNLNMAKIIADAKAGKYDAQVLEDMEDGKKVGVNGTPTFFINGQMLPELGYGPLKQAIEEALNK
jgi:protein-disulfide isomerase